MSKIRSRNPRELLTPAALHILMALADGERYGYAIKGEVEARTAGALRLGPGTLYEAIHRMKTSGWIRAVGDHDEVRQGGARKCYRITAAGRKRMTEELERLDGIVSFARSRALLESP